jgi:hypothetical protein
VQLTRLERQGYGNRADEELRVTYAEMNGFPYLGVRVWYTDEETGEVRPTKRGCTIKVGEIEAVVAALQKGLELAQANRQPRAQQGRGGPAPRQQGHQRPQAGGPNLPLGRDPALPPATYSNEFVNDL